MNHRIVRSLVAISASLLLVFALAGCSDGGDSVDVAVSEGGDGNPAAMSSGGTQYESGEVQVTIFPDADKADYDITLNYFIDGWMYPEGAPGGTVSPSEGMKLVVMNLSVDVHGELVAIVKNDFNLQVGGEKYLPIDFYGGHDRVEFPSFEMLQDGASETYDMVFEVPADADLSGATYNYAEFAAEEDSTMEFSLGQYM